MSEINTARFNTSLYFLNKKHVTLFVLLRDTILMNNAEKSPHTIGELFVSASARELFLQRKNAITRLRHSGISVIDVLPTQVTPRLVDKYLEIKARNWV
jgi:uncharacterized protein (DUF58 family)